MEEVMAAAAEEEEEAANRAHGHCPRDAQSVKVRPSIIRVRQVRGRDEVGDCFGGANRESNCEFLKSQDSRDVLHRQISNSTCSA